MLELNRASAHGTKRSQEGGWQGEKGRDFHQNGKKSSMNVGWVVAPLTFCIVNFF